MLYAAGATGNGAGATALLPAPASTAEDGTFSLAGLTCPTAATQVYAVARGGNPGLVAGTANPALTFVSALGDCSSLTATSTLLLNERTTAAAAWALARFAAPGAILGATSTNANGLRNAFLVTANLVDSSTGAAPGPTLPAGAIAPTPRLNTLANALYACAHSDGGSACAPLLAAAGDATNTFDAALAIVRHPAANVAATFAAASPSGPFQPALPAAPADWSLPVTYTTGGLNLPGGLAVDSTGNVWVANYFGGAASRFSPTGQPSTFAGGGLHESYEVAVDPDDNAWFTNQESTSSAINGGAGSLTRLSPTGQVLSGTGFVAGGIYFPQALAADTNGNIWVANFGSSSASLLSSSGAAISASGAYAASAIPFTSAVAVDAHHNAWFAAQREVVRVAPDGTYSTFPCCNNPTGIAVDSSGFVWVADYTLSTLFELTPSGTVVHTAAGSGGLSSPNSLAIDGQGTIWTTNYHGNSVTAVSGSGSSSPATPLSGSRGLGSDAGLNAPYGLAVDASGNLWVSNSGNNTLTQFVGLAEPVRTPVLGPASAP